MTGLSALAVALALLGESNGYWIARQLDRPEIREVLPIGFAIELAPWVRLGLHDRPELPSVFYSPDTLWRSEPGGPLTAFRMGPAINLLASSFRDREGLRSPMDLGIDQNQPYFEALIQAYLELRVLPLRKGYVAVMKHRAVDVFTEVPPAQQLDAYLEALSAFGSDILTIAIQIHRSTETHRARGSDLCRFANTPTRTLYTIWQRNFTDSQYPGMYRDQRGRWRTTFSFLAAEDKALFVDQVFEGRWNGDPIHDFCSASRSRD